MKVVLSDIQEAKKPLSRNVLRIVIDENQILIDNKACSLEEVKSRVSEFLISDPERDDLPEFEEVITPLLGKRMSAIGVVNIEIHPKAEYQDYIDVYKTVTDGFLKLRDKTSLDEFQKPFDQLDDDQEEAIKDLHPLRIAEGEYIPSTD